MTKLIASVKLVDNQAIFIRVKRRRTNDIGRRIKPVLTFKL